MPTPTYDLIASNVLTSATTSITFSSISGSYRDLVLVMQATGATGNGNFRLAFNGSTANFFKQYMYGDGTNSGAGSPADSILTESTFYTTSAATLTILQVFDYSQTDKHKPCLARSNRAGAGTDAINLRWASTSAITSITIDNNLASQFASGSTFYLYGIVS